MQPVENMHLGFGASYLNAEYESLIVGSSVTLDDELPFAPEWQINASASYDIPTAYGISRRESMWGIWMRRSMNTVIASLPNVILIQC